MQFSGESAWDAIVNDNSLDIEQEESFEEFIASHGVSKESPADVLQQLFDQWQQA
jgi:hypothetical protein